PNMTVEEVRRKIQEVNPYFRGGRNAQQCVTLAKAFTGSTLPVTDWRRGEAMSEGHLKPGAPVATFLNRKGELSDRYAGGGTGTPGAGLDHAGIFLGNVYDKQG